MAESPQIPLPFAEREYIDMPHCCRILGVGETVARRMAESGLFLLIDHLPHSYKKVHYQSLVDFCNRLREAYNIADERPKLVPPYRYRDRDLLPFPLDDTIGIPEAIRITGCGFKPLMRLIDEGRITAYRLHPRARTKWRISRQSVVAHMERVMRGVAGGPNAYVEVAVD